MPDLSAPSLRQEPAVALLWSEFERLRALERYQILDTPSESDFDDLVRLAAQMCNAPAAAISLVAQDRQWFKSEIGLGIRQTTRDVAFCAHAIQQPDLFVVPDTLRDPRFSNNPLVTEEPKLRFYAGALLETPQGLPLGTLCVFDVEPRQLGEQEAFVLRTLAAQVMTQLELRRALREQRRTEERQTCLLRLGDRLRDLKDPQQMIAEALLILGQSLHAQHLEFARIHSDRVQAAIECEWHQGVLRYDTGLRSLQDYAAAVIATLQQGEVFAGAPQIVAAELLTAPFGGYERSAQIAVPIIKQGQLIAFLLAEAAPDAREWTDADVALLREAAARTWSALERLQAELALRHIGEDLERQVAERTAELSFANELLTAEMAERERAEAQLRQVQKMEAVGQLTGGIAHDFNNMLGGIIGGLELMQKRIASGRYHQLEALIGTATTSAHRGAALTHRLLAFSRQQALDPKLIEVNRLVSSMRELLQRTLGESIDFEARLADDLWNARADENQLESALLNLIINARDAMPKGGQLIVQTDNVTLDQRFADANAGAAAGDYVCLSVRDNG
ncbi:MAG: hypothetical protein JWR16_3014, partial [Nevskia sp.]|nr:hypothetical protein [Nevskia sp.]